MLRFWLALVAAKIVYRGSRLLGRQGTTISGAVALRIDPNILERLGRNFKTLIFVTGTNGKTTTSNLLARMMRQNGQEVLHNWEGANMLTGVASCLLKKADWRGRVRADSAVFEVDEGSLSGILKQIKPSHILILNFFRDQLDRYGEIDVLIRQMMRAVQSVDTQLILNTDDPLVMQFDALDKHSVYFGVQANAVSFGHYAIGESIFCPRCGEEMNYRHIHFGQLGDYACSCGFSRKTPQYEVGIVEKQSPLSFRINEQPITTSLKGNFNVYNVLAAVSAALECGIGAEQIRQVLFQYHPSNGRMETIMHKGVPYILNLNKNPSGTNVMLHEIVVNPNPKQLFIILNDHVADGEDISWIWDVHFEVLQASNLSSIVCSGTRSSELALRLKYAGLLPNLIQDIPSIPEAVLYCLDHSLQTYVLPTYSALDPVLKCLRKKVRPA